MNIIIVGCGKIGFSLVSELINEGHDVTVVDTDSAAVEEIVNISDCMGVCGNGVDCDVLDEAGVENAELFVSVTGSDEFNMLSCYIAKRMGAKQTIARIRNPEYNDNGLVFLKQNLNLSMTINPELLVAKELYNLLKLPSAAKVEMFSKRNFEMIELRLKPDSQLDGMTLIELKKKYPYNYLVCAVKRDENVYIPDGNFTLQAGDIITIVGKSAQVAAFFKKLGLPTSRTKDVMIIGGGETSYYLANLLTDIGIDVKIVDKSRARCEELSELLPKAMVICGDGTERELLMEEGLPSAGAFVAMTNLDEENIMLSLFAKSQMKGKVITRIHRIAYDEIVANLDLDSIVYPKSITAEIIIKFVRAMHNSLGSNIETLYRLNEGKVEALEFLIKEDCPIVGVPLQELKLKDNLLVCSINHKGTILTPGGQSVMSVGDTVVIVTTATGFHDIRDILE